MAMKYGSLSEQEYRAVYKKGQQFTSKILKAYCLPSERTKIGIVASGQIGNAVKRNRAKRLLRAAVSTLIKEKNREAHLVLQAKKELLGHKEQEVRSYLEQALKRFLII